MGNPRMNIPGTVYFVTNRCLEERFMMKPGHVVNRIIGGWLARAIQKHPGIEVYGFVFLSNHFHMLVRDNAGQLAHFMWYFQSNAAIALNRHLGRQGVFFARAYDAAPVLTDADVLDRHGYLLANAVRAGLVDQASQWPGLSSLGMVTEKQDTTFTLLDRTEMHKKTRRGQKVDKKDFIKAYDIQLSVIPMWEGKSEAQVRELTLDLVQSREVMYRNQRRAEGRSAMGVRRIMAQKPTDRPSNPSRSPRVIVFCRDEELREAYLRARKEFIAEYRKAYAMYLRACLGGRIRAEWPEHGYPPSCMFVVGTVADG